MNAHSPLDAVDTLPVTVEIALPEVTDAKAFFGSSDAVAEAIDKIRTAVRSHVPDLTTRKGRDAIASLAYRVSKSKTYLDGEGKKLVEGIKKQAEGVDKARKQIRDELDALRDEARKPLDLWEAEEAERQSRDAAIMRQIADHGLTGQEASRDIVAAAGRIRDIALPDDFTGDRDAAESTRAATMQALRNMFTAAQTREAEAAELAKLREEKAARDAADEAARIEREKAEAERLAAEREEQDRKDAEERQKAEAERIEHARQEAAEQAAADAEARHQRELADAKRREDEAAQRERDRIAEEQRKADEEQRKREESTRIRNRVRRDIAASLAGLAQPLTPEIVAEALMAGGIPNCTVRF